MERKAKLLSEVQKNKFHKFLRNISENPEMYLDNRKIKRTVKNKLLFYDIPSNDNFMKDNLIKELIKYSNVTLGYSKTKLNSKQIKAIISTLDNNHSFATILQWTFEGITRNNIFEKIKFNDELILEKRKLLKFENNKKELVKIKIKIKELEDKIRKYIQKFGIYKPFYEEYKIIYKTNYDQLQTDEREFINKIGYFKISLTSALLILMFRNEKNKEFPISFKDLETFKFVQFPRWKSAFYKDGNSLKR